MDELNLFDLRMYQMKTYVMYRKIVLVLGLISLNFVAFSQTKWIWHKSHSGSKSSFNTSLYNNLFDIGESNFGMAPRMDVCMARLYT